MCPRPQAVFNIKLSCINGVSSDTGSKPPKLLSPVNPYVIYPEVRKSSYEGYFERYQHELVMCTVFLSFATEHMCTFYDFLQQMTSQIASTSMKFKLVTVLIFSSLMVFATVNLLSSFKLIEQGKEALKIKSLAREVPLREEPEYKKYFQVCVFVSLLY